MTITEFLEARIAEDEAAAERCASALVVPAAVASTMLDPVRMFAECAAKRAIIKQHEKWPVLVEREPSEIEQVAAGLNDITYRMTREVAFLTEREYVKRFGVEAPTAPMIRTLAAVYKGHPDYREEWAD